MRTGQLDIIIEIYTPTKTRKSSGQEARTYTKLGELFASVDYRGGVEKTEADQKIAERTCMFSVYDRILTITEEMLIKHDSKYWEIMSVTPDKTRFYLDIMAKKRDNLNIGL